MERSEPSLVPEWLKSSGSVTGSGTTTHPLSSLSSNSDDHAILKLARNKPVNSSDYDLGRSSASDRASSSYFRRSSSSNGYAHLRSYSSFGRSQRGGRDWEKDVYESRDKDKSVLGDLKHWDYSESLGNIYPSRFEKDGLRRSQSMISGKRGEGLPRKPSADSTAPKNDGVEGNSVLNKVGSTSTYKAAFEREFPSLGSEERQSAPEIGRVPSPGSGTNIHGLPTSAAIGGDKWISALAEVPAMVGNGGTGSSSGQQTSACSASTLVSSSTTGLNMAEAVAHGPQRAHAAPQLSAGTQRLEELVIKQSRQLIPVTPSMPKALVLGSSDKVKSKAGQPQHLTSTSSSSSSSLLSPPFRGGPVKTDFSKTSNSGKLLVLKPARERNGVIPAVKDSLSPTNNTRTANSPLASVGGLSASKGPSNNPSSPSADWKHVPTMSEKRLTSHAQSRNDFFNLVRKKSMAASMSVPDPGRSPSVSPSISFKASEQEIVPAPATPQGRNVTGSPKGCESTESKGSLTWNCDAFDGEKYLENGRNHLSSNPISSEEEEAAFLRSLGWEENADEDGLTEEEIDAFLNKHLNSKLSLKILQGVEPRFLLPLRSQGGTISSGLNSSDSKLES